MIVKKSKGRQPKYAAALAATQQQQEEASASSHATVGNYNSSQYAIYEGQHQRARQKQTRLEPEDEEEENDEENIVIDMADEDDDDDDESPIEEESPYGANSNEVIMRKASANQATTMTAKLNGQLEAGGIGGQADAPEPNNNNNQPATPAQFEPGDLIWFDPNQLGYSIPGKVLDFYQELCVLTVEGCGQPLALEDPQLDEQLRNRLLVKADEQLQVYELSEPQLFKTIRRRKPISNEQGVSDLVELDELSHESIIWNLKLRFKQDLIYTKCGHKILFALNPFKQLCHLYSLDQVQQYDALDAQKLASLSSASANSSKLIRWLLLNERQQVSKSSQRAREPSQSSLAPHIFGLANEALKQLLTNCQDQCFVLLGDSGAGKTETAKLLIQYYATVNKSPTNLITEQILESIQVLESFGSAKTASNNNSSRFGKLLELRFNLSNGFIHDAKSIDLNLLDRTRIVCQNEQERNYNIFYELLAGLSKLEKEKYGLQSAEKYFYLNQGHCVELQAKDDSEDFRSLLSSMQVLGFNYEEQDTIFRILATILHLGNIYFHRKLLAVRLGAKFDTPEQQQKANGAAGIEGVEIGSDTEARWVSHLLQVQFDLVLRCLTVRTIETGAIIQPEGEQALGKQQATDCIVSPLNIDQALDTRDAIARALYTCLFKWLVQRINVMINSKTTSELVDDHNDEQHSRSEQNKEDPASEPIYLCRTSESLCEFQPDKLVTANQRQVQRQKDKLNKRHKREHEHQRVGQQLATLSILDAFGFENLAENNFEQLCINYAAESLHYHTNRYLVRLEQAEYVRERIRWQPIESLAGLTSSTSGSADINTLNSNTSLNQQYGSFNSSGRSNSLASSQQRQAASIVNLISKKPLGILALLDDECNFPKATDQSFAEKCHHNHALNENYQCARLAANSQEFGIRHFRRTTRMVWYQVDGFIEKNRDTLRADVMELLLGSKMSVVADMLRKLHKPYNSSSQAAAGEGCSSINGVAKTIRRTYDGRYVSMKPRAATVAAKFQDTLQNNRVLEALNHVASSSQVSVDGDGHTDGQLYSTSSSSKVYIDPTYGNMQQRAVAVSSGQQANPWFIVCLKPNRSKSARIFDVAYVQEQVHAMNLLALAQMRRIGYPVRLRYQEFLRRYKCLVTQKFLAECKLLSLNSHKKSDQHIASIREICTALIEFRLARDALKSQINNSIEPQFQCGLTKMFLNERLFHELEGWRLAEYQKSILVMQKTWKMWLERREFLEKRHATIVIQANWRGQLARRSFMQQYVLIVLLQRRWRRQLHLRRQSKLEARRRALKQQQRAQLDELKAQQNKLDNQLRFRLQPKSSASGGSSNYQDKSHYYTSSNSTSSSSTNATSRTATNLLDIPEDLAQLYRLQRDWLPQHDLSHLTQVNLAELACKELARRDEFGSNSSSVPFVVLDSDLKKITSLQDDCNPLEQANHLISQLDLDERFSLQKFVSKYFHPEVPQFGYSRLPITRPFSWRQMFRSKRHAIRRIQSLDCGVQQVGALERRFIALEQKAVAIYKLLLRYIDSDQTSQRQPSRLDSVTVASDDQQHSIDEYQREQEALLLQQMLKFKLISDYINYLCLTEPLLRDEVFLQLASLSWQNPKARSLENVWKLLLNCLACFEPLDCNLIKHLLKYVADYCQSSKYKQLLCSQLFTALERAKVNYKMIEHSKRQGIRSKLQPQVSALSEQRRFPTTIMEYWANQSAQTKLAIAASCYMDDHTLSASDLEQLVKSERSIDEAELRQIINYSAKTLVEIDSHSRAERVANEILRARGVGESNLVGWSLEIQHEGALSEFSSRLRGDDHLMDHFARLELLPELVQLIDDDLEALDCEQLDELGVRVDQDEAVEQSQLSGPNELASPSCCRSPQLSRRFDDVQEIQREAARRPQTKQSRLSSVMSNRSWDFEAAHLSSSRPHSGQYARRHSAAMSELDLMSSRRSSGQFHYKYARDPQQVAAFHDRTRDGPQPFEVNGHYRPSRADARRSEHRRSMSMQELQLAASSALNERYFMPQARLPTAQFAAPQTGADLRDYACCRAPSSIASGTSRARRQSGSLRHLDQASNQQPLMMMPQRQYAGGRRRSATPNSLMSSGYCAHRKQPISASSSIYGYASSARDESRAQYAASQGYADFGVPQERYGRSQKRRGPRLDATQQMRPRRAASTSSRAPIDSAVPPTSDYASTHSEYEQIAAGRANRRPHPKVAKQEQPSRHGRRLEQPPSALDNSAVHYAASSAMSDTSEAPSLASHVKGVKVPQPNGDLDRYLDDLFNPLLDGADLDELSDARSMATSIRGLGASAELSNLFDGEKLSKMIRGTGGESERGEEASTRDATDQRETQTLSPTFESLLRSLKTQASGLGNDDDELLSTTAQLVRKSTNLHELNLSQLKELNQKLEHEIQAAQSARQSLNMGNSSGSPRELAQASLPPPPPLPNFNRSTPAGDAVQSSRSSSSPMSQATLDDIYSRAKTIRIGKWRWPPPAEESSTTAALTQDAESPKNDEEQLFVEQLAALATDRKRSSILSTGSGGELNSADNAETRAESKEVASQDASSVAGDKHPDANNSQTFSSAVGRLKISSEMKAKLESLTNSSGGRVSDSASSSSAQQAAAATTNNETGDAGAPPKRLNEQRKLLLASKLMGAGKSSDSPDEFEQQQRPTSVGSKVLAVKQQLAAAAGVALSALDSHSAGSSQASSRRQSSQLVASGAPGSDQHRRLVLENDELGPQSRVAINQRQAFYLDANGTALTNKPSQSDQGGFIAEPPASVCGHQRKLEPQVEQETSDRASSAMAKGKLPVNLYGIDRDKFRVEASSSNTNDQWTWSPSASRNATATRVTHSKASSKKAQPIVGSESRKEAVKKNLNPGQRVECLTYANVNWQVRIRKELFRPSESYDDALVVQLIFAQLVADVFNPRHWTRLNHKERAAIKAMMKDNSIGYSASLPQIGQLQEVKRELVRMARSFGLYFTRSYQALNFACLTENHPLLSRPPGDSSGSDSHSESESSDSASELSSSLDSRSNKTGAAYLGPKEAIRLAQQLRAKASLGAEWIDMVAVHHSGLRLVALVCDEQPAQQLTADAGRRQSVASDRLSIRNSKQFIANQIGGCPGGQSSELPPTPPIGYKVLETLKFRDMADVRQLNERLLLVSMAPSARTSSATKCWLISSSQANQLVALLKSFHLDYNKNVRNSTTQNSKGTATKPSNVGQATRNRKPVSLSEFEPQAKVEQQRNRQKQKSVAQDALLVGDDDHDGDHLQQRQAPDCVGPERAPTAADDVLAHTQRVLPNHLAPSRAAPPASEPGSDLGAGERGRRRRPRGQQQSDERSDDTDSQRAGRSPTGHQSDGAGGRAHDRGSGRSYTQPAASELDRSRTPATTSGPSGTLNERQEARQAQQEASNAKVDHNNDDDQKVGRKLKAQKQPKGWQNSLSRMSSRFNLFGGSIASAGSKSSKQQHQQQQQLADQSDAQADGQQQVTLDAWIETKVDFDDENDDQTSQTTSDRFEAMKRGESQHQDRRTDPADSSKYSTLTGSNRLSSGESADAQTLRSSGTASVKDDGKYSMLQFALYNFREAIEKYSLESRTSLRNGAAVSKQSARDSQAGHCSTLRGSLKLIESMRNSNSSGPEELQPANAAGHQQTAAGGKQEWTWRELAEMVKFTRAPLKRPLLRLDESAELERRAVDCFAAIMRYMGDLPPATTIQVNPIGTGGTSKPVKLTIPESDVECVYLILINCHNYSKLRDEIYCQLIKQTTNNRSEQSESCLRGWRLLSLLAAYFDCSAHFRPYLVNYLEQNAFDKRRAYHSVALLCLQNLRKTFKFGGRKNVPSIEEIAALSAGRISKRQIYRLPGGTERVINTKSTTVVDDIIREICTSMLMVEEESEMFEFSLYCIADGDLYTMPLNRDEYILDITTELIKNHQQYFLIFCRSIWHYPLRLDSKLYIELTFNQIAPDYLEGLLLVLPMGSISTGSRPHQPGTRTGPLPATPLNLKSKLLREIARLAALLHRASGTDHQPQRDEVKYLLPKPIVQLIKQQQRALSKKTSSGSSDHYASTQQLVQSVAWPTQQQLVELVQELWREMSAFEPLDAKAQFLDVVRHWPLFGSSFFAIKLIQRDLIQPTEFILALNKFGIQMLDTHTHETRHKYSFNEVISTRKVRSEDGALFLDMKCGNLMKRTIIRIQTDQAHEISRLIRQYIDIELMQANTDNNIATDELADGRFKESMTSDQTTDT